MSDVKDIVIKPDAPKSLLTEKHIAYVQKWEVGLQYPRHHIPILGFRSRSPCLNSIPFPATWLVRERKLRVHHVRISSDERLILVPNSNGCDELT